MNLQEIKDLLEEVSGEVPKTELIPDSVDYNILCVSLPELGVKITSYQDSDYPLDNLKFNTFKQHFDLLKYILLRGIEKIQEGA
jgi:hypothetical protein